MNTINTVNEKPDFKELCITDFMGYFQLFLKEIDLSKFTFEYDADMHITFITNINKHPQSKAMFDKFGIFDNTGEMFMLFNTGKVEFPHNMIATLSIQSTKGGFSWIQFFKHNKYNVLYSDVVEVMTMHFFLKNKFITDIKLKNNDCQSNKAMIKMITDFNAGTLLPIVSYWDLIK